MNPTCYALLSVQIRDLPYPRGYRWRPIFREPQALKTSANV